MILHLKIVIRVFQISILLQLNPIPLSSDSSISKQSQRKRPPSLHPPTITSLVIIISVFPTPWHRGEAGKQQRPFVSVVQHRHCPYLHCIPQQQQRIVLFPTRISIFRWRLLCQRHDSGVESRFGLLQATQGVVYPACVVFPGLLRRHPPMHCLFCDSWNFEVLDGLMGVSICQQDLEMVFF